MYLNNHFSNDQMEITELIRKKSMLRGLSPRTIKTYTYVVNSFLRKYHKAAFEVTKNDIEKHCLLLLEQNSCGNTINVHLNALKFFYEECLGRKLTVNIRYYKVPRNLPEFLTQEETIKLLNAITNQKHLLMITLMYSAGLRVSELLNLKVKDLHLNEAYGWVRQGKGKKDRVFIIAEKLKRELASWTNNLFPENYIFSNYNAQQMSSQTIRKIISSAAKQAGISKRIHPHTLRHSFATHLIENGYAVTEVQPLLGHSSIDTTMIYLHMASPQLLKVKSPLDSL